MTEHTRELSVEAHDEPEEFWFPDGYVSVRSGDGVIAILGGEEAHYANMFAAAPDLLAALVDVLPMAEALLRVGGAFRERPAWMVEQDRYGRAAVDAARAAIVRARGEG